MVIMVSTVFSLYLCQPQMQNQIHTTIQDHKLIFLQLVYKHPLLHANMLFLMKLVIHMTIQQHIPGIKFFFKELNRV